MTLRISTGLRNQLLQHGSLKSAMRGAKLLIYTGTQPATADTAVAGTLLATLTLASGAHTFETRASGTITLTGTTGGISTLTVNGINLIPDGAVAFATSLTQTASNLAAAINRNSTSPDYVATSSAAVVTITAMRGSGAAPNTFVVTATYTTDMGGTYANMAGGVDSVNGIDFGVAASGALAKSATVWSGLGVAAGTAGWGRMVVDSADAGETDSGSNYARLDGACGTATTNQFVLSTTTVAISDTVTCSTFNITMPGG